MRRALADESRKNTDDQVMHGTAQEMTPRGHTVMFWRAGGEAEGGAALDCTSGRTHPDHLHLHDDRSFIPSRLAPRPSTGGACLRNTLFSWAKASLYGSFRITQARSMVVLFLRSPRQGMSCRGEACSASARMRGAKLL